MCVSEARLLAYRLSASVNAICASLFSRELSRLSFLKCDRVWSVSGCDLRFALLARAIASRLFQNAIAYEVSVDAIRCAR